MSIAEKIRYFAMDKFGGIKRLANALGIADTTIHRYISGDSMPGAPFLVKMKKAGCDMNWLLGEETLPDGTQNPLHTELEKLREENRMLRARLKKIEDCLR